jgi:GTP-binding protein
MLTTSAAGPAGGAAAGGRLAAPRRPLAPPPRAGRARGGAGAKSGGRADAAAAAPFLSALEKLEKAAGEDALESAAAATAWEALLAAEGPGREAAAAIAAAQAAEEDDDDGGGGGGVSDLGLTMFGEAVPGPAPRRPNEARSRRGSRGARPPPEVFLPDELLPLVAIVGRPNVGKSALFNRLVGRQVAIVYDTPGVTRDRLYTRASWGGRDFMLVDTGGLTSDAAALGAEAPAAAAAGLPAAIERQAAAAVATADALVLVVDGQTGASAEDTEVISWLRRQHARTPVLLAVNKCENAAKADLQAAEFWETGLEPIALSAISGTGTGELLDRLVAALPPPAAQPPPAALAGTPADDDPVSLAIVGRPNVGKSSLLNAIAGEERAIVSPMPGTTRDAVDFDVADAAGRRFTLVDTAGVRRRASVASTRDGAEPLSVERAFRAVRRAEVAVLVVDAAEGVTAQDFRLAEYIAQQGRACVVAVNKWDAVPAKTNTTLADFETLVRSQLRPVEWANVVFVSAKTGQRVARVLDAAAASAVEHRRRVSTATLNMVVREAAAWRAPPSTGGGRRGRVYYATQASARPPSFVLFCNDPSLFGEDYRKYMERALRENVGFQGTPLRLYFRGKSQAG